MTDVHMEPVEAKLNMGTKAFCLHEGVLSQVSREEVSKVDREEGHSGRREPRMDLCCYRV